jgi:hypothetical protein
MNVSVEMKSSKHTRSQISKVCVCCCIDRPWRHGGHQEVRTNWQEDKTSHQQVLPAVHSARRPVSDVGKLLITKK